MLSYVEILKEKVDEFCKLYYEFTNNKIKLNRVDGGIDVGDGIIIDDWIIMNYMIMEGGLGDLVLKNLRIIVNGIMVVFILGLMFMEWDMIVIIIKWKLGINTIKWF